jgi:hypothetical protein
MRSARLSPLLVLLLLAGAPALTACQTDSTAKPMAQAAPPAPPTRQEAAWQCWASVDKTHKDLSLDKRADIVSKCINDKMNPGPAPQPPKAKT